MKSRPDARNAAAPYAVEEIRGEQDQLETPPAAAPTAERPGVVVYGMTRRELLNILDENYPNAIEARRLEAENKQLIQEIERLEDDLYGGKVERIVYLRLLAVGGWKANIVCHDGVERVFRSMPDPREDSEPGRPALPAKRRFLILARDDYRCQYCGRSAPEVVLVVDHVQSVFDGGSNDDSNLVTACFDCNAGKGKRSAPKPHVKRAASPETEEE